MKKYILLLQCCICFSSVGLSQNVGIGTITPQATLHIKGSANSSQLIIDASATQSNTQPLIRLRDASGVDLLHLHSDNIFNTFIGFNAGRTNTASPGLGVANTFIAHLRAILIARAFIIPASGKGHFFQTVQEKIIQLLGRLRYTTTWGIIITLWG